MLPFGEVDAFGDLAGKSRVSLPITFVVLLKSLFPGYYNNDEFMSTPPTVSGSGDPTKDVFFFFLFAFSASFLSFSASFLAFSSSLRFCSAIFLFYFSSSSSSLRFYSAIFLFYFSISFLLTSKYSCTR